MGQAIAFVNQKGGVTKTTSVANTAAALVERGQRVLAVDADPQANLTESFGAEEARGLKLEDVLATAEADRRAAMVAGVGEGDKSTLPGGVHLLPCSDELADVAAELPRQAGYELRLREALVPLRDAFDYILIDTPPGLGVLSGMALIAADAVIVPVRPADLDVGGAAKVYDLVETELRELSPQLEVLGVLVAQAQRRWVLRRDTHEAIEAQGMTALPVEIPFSVRVGAAPRYGAPTFVLEPDGRVAQAYRALADHLLARGAGLKAAA